MSGDRLAADTGPPDLERQVEPATETLEAFIEGGSEQDARALGDSFDRLRHLETRGKSGDLVQEILLGDTLQELVEPILRKPALTIADPPGIAGRIARNEIVEVGAHAVDRVPEDGHRKGARRKGLPVGRTVRSSEEVGAFREHAARIRNEDVAATDGPREPRTGDSPPDIHRVLPAEPEEAQVEAGSGRLAHVIAVHPSAAVGQLIGLGQLAERRVAAYFPGVPELTGGTTERHAGPGLQSPRVHCRTTLGCAGPVPLLRPPDHRSYTTSHQRLGGSVSP